MKSFVLSVLASIMIAMSPFILWSVWYIRNDGGYAQLWFWSLIEMTAFAGMIWVVYSFRPRKCVWCGAVQE